jgi:hypothetical protein
VSVPKKSYPVQPAPTSMADYHADRSRVSHSMLEVYHRSPELYHKRFVAGTVAGKEGDHFDFGTALHCLLLEPHEFDGRYWTGVKPKLNSRLGKEEWSEMRAANEGRRFIDTEDYEMMRAMEKSLDGNRIARNLLRGKGVRQPERVFHGTLEGLPAKCRTDLFLPPSSMIVDVKTMRDPDAESFARDCVNYGYFRQEALYRSIVDAAFGIESQFRFVVFGKNEPYDCFVYELGSDSVRLGAYQNQQDLRRLAESIKTGRFRNPGADIVNLINLPSWYFNNFAKEIKHG